MAEVVAEADTGVLAVALVVVTVTAISSTD
jgi:hypothetical protein